jgi:hypothetical protein
VVFGGIKSLLDKNTFVMEATGRPRDSSALSPEPLLPSGTSVGDTDESPTRKRPRLDSASDTIKSLSSDAKMHISSDAEADSVHSPAALSSATNRKEEPSGGSASPIQQHPNKVTINVRALSVGAHESDTQTKANGGLEPVEHDSYVNASQVEVVPSDVEVTGATESLIGNNASEEEIDVLTRSPDVEIEIDEPEDVDDGRNRSVIIIDGQNELMAEHILERFPYSDRFGPIGAASVLKDHFEKGTLLQ